MKSVLISFVMFAAVLGAMYVGLFDVMSSSYMFGFAAAVLLAALIFALKVLGNPFAKEKKNDDR